MTQSEFRDLCATINDEIFDLRTNGFKVTHIRVHPTTFANMHEAQKKSDETNLIVAVHNLPTLCGKGLVVTFDVSGENAIRYEVENEASYF